MAVLVVYFSRAGENIVDDKREIIEKGFTEIVAEKIQKITGGALVKLQPVEEYPFGYDECNRRARKEYEENILPEVKNLPASIDAYDTIYIGFPLWYRSYPRIISRFIKSYSFLGKTVKPFCTNEEGTFGIMELELRSMLKGAIVKDGLAIRGYDADKSDELIKEWLTNNETC